MSTTTDMSAKTRAARIRKTLTALDLPGVARVTVKTNRASMMTAIDVRLHTFEAPRTMVHDDTFGETWPLTPLAAAAVETAETVGTDHGATTWADNKTTFFTVEAVQNR